MVGHLDHFAAARPEPLNHRAHKALGDIDAQQLVWLHDGAVDAPRHDLRPRHHHLEALTAHHFDEHGKLQLAAPQHFEGFRAAGIFHADGDVGEQLLIEALLQIARGHVRAFAAGEGRVVH